jgi:hypothetical protein
MTHVETPQSRLRAGVAQGDITPPVGIYHRMWGAATHDRSTGVHRPLLATVLWLAPTPSVGQVSNLPVSEAVSDSAAEGHLLVALDHCILERPEVENVRAAVSAAADIAPEQIHVTLSHTHAAGLMLRSRADQPGGDLIGPYLDELARRVAGLAAEAVTTARPATIVYGQGRCNLAAQRDFWDAGNKQFVCGFNPKALADDTVLVGRIVGDDGADVAVIVNYACHPTTLAFENQAISPDYVGALRETVTAATGAPCLFLQGASGDLGPREGFVGDAAIADRNGRQLGYAVLSALETLPRPGTRYVYQGPVISGAILGIWKHQPDPPKAMARQAASRCERWIVELAYRPDLPDVAETRQQYEHWLGEEERAHNSGDAAAARDCRAKAEQMRRRLLRLETLPPGKAYPYPVTLWRLGDAVWLILPGEHYQELQRSLRARFPGLAIIIVTLADDWLPGYVPTATTYGHGIYQETIAVVAAGSAELLLEEITRRIHGVLRLDAALD